MQEHGAAAAGDARARVVIDLDDEIVEMILARQPVALVVARDADRLVVMPVVGVFAPGVGGRDGARWRDKCAGADAGRRATTAVADERCRAASPPSPSRLLARMPPRPSATGMAKPGAVSQPFREFPAVARILIMEIGRSRPL